MRVLGIILAVLLIIAVLTGTFLFWGFIWMIGLGAFSHIFGAANLAISYWNSVLVSLIISVLVGGFLGLVRGSK